MTATLVTLALIFAELSLLAFGGGNTILPEMQRQVVDIHHWMTAQEFGALFALAQAAPGPNMMVVPLVGWHVAGFSGVLVTSLAKFGPSSLVTGFALRLWERFKDRPWRRTVQAGLVPVTAGLVTASAIIITHASASSWGTILIAASVAIATTTTRIHPLLALAAGAALGLTGIGQP
ncbi:chromate transporter [Bradyrhizobium viridifuturi]|jgi:chromate transporter|uniref:chromate transporter n=1 Tax=Bradyrhizobium TaxID=374 RepID=UPI0003968901|nr:MULTISPECIES: chromate transporter [Bradyrhizobium]ERF82449.1 MAG: chromate transporter [Bradyrhizobium sp. DFCI-1]OYU62799.1 MAG: chromate transporter [Bradyrhizobium sp. PARBB1]PSO22201.1 chromate transporter [Bradyrhizobium sp. MOS004]QRI70705.1 chromate transporter [Bradyrhizobium sp. PSBB068]MBR1023792.1 chromate transporter [Bradyrhizobium viridifuturi]